MVRIAGINAFATGALPRTPLGDPRQTYSRLGKETPSRTPLIIHAFLDVSMLRSFGASTLGASRFSLLKVGAYAHQLCSPIMVAKLE